MYLHTCVYIYIYIERERERERDFARRFDARSREVKPLRVLEAGTDISVVVYLLLILSGKQNTFRMSMTCLSLSSCLTVSQTTVPCPSYRCCSHRHSRRCRRCPCRSRRRHHCFLFKV